MTPSPASSPQDVVLAFSGGLDTSFCIPYLLEKGYRITTIFVDTGGVSGDERTFITNRAAELGAHRHVNHDASEALWSEFVEPFVMAGVAYQDQYPLLCSDRYLIVKAMTQLAKEIGTNLVAHGCTAMGNDQVRFDHSIRSLGSFEILAPIRDIQAVTQTPRAYEIDYLKQRGFEVNATTTQYTVNENVLGITISGSEIDEFQKPGPNTHFLTKPRADWPTAPLTATIEFKNGIAVALNNEKIPGPEILKNLNQSFGKYGVGRGMYTGDTTIGLKGRIVYECPGLTALLTAHRAHEEAILTSQQNTFKPIAARKWVDLVYSGFFFDPLKRDLDALLRSMQSFITGTVTLETTGGICHAVAIASHNILTSPEATYAQGATWSAEEAIGFIKLFGQSSAISAQVNPQH